MINKLFQKPKFLNKDEDKKVKFAPLKNYKHAKIFHFVPVGISEVNELCKEYAVFMSQDGENIIPIILLGVEENKNLFLDEKANWEKKKQIPLMFRLYPFTFANVIKKENEFELSIAYDSEYEGISSKGTSVFTQTGELTKFGENIKKSVTDAYLDIEKTTQICNVLKELKLLKQVDANIEKDGKRFVINSLLQIDEQKLNSLSDEDILKVTKSGAMNLVYAHLVSQSNMNKLIEKI